MDYAIAMYNENHRVVYASDKNINYESFKDILCLECRGLVYLKCKVEGSKRKAHFAHYSECNRNCSLRITVKNQNQDWRALTPVGRGQRQRKFYEYFNYMITKDAEVVRIIQEVENSCCVKNLQKLTQECLNWLLSNASSLQKELTITPDIFLDEQSRLKIIMRFEAIDFFTKSYTRTSLKFLVYYFFYKTCDFQIYTNLSSWLNECSVDHIIPELKKIIIETDWRYIFGYHHRHGTFPQKDKEEKSQDKEEKNSVKTTIQDIKQICCFLDIKHSLNVQVRGTSLSGRILLQKQNNLFICFTNYTRTVKIGIIDILLITGGSDNNQVITINWQFIENEYMNFYEILENRVNTFLQQCFESSEKKQKRKRIPFKPNLIKNEVLKTARKKADQRRESD